MIEILIEIRCRWRCRRKPTVPASSCKSRRNRAAQIETHGESLKVIAKGTAGSLSSLEGAEKIALTTCSTINPGRKKGWGVCSARRAGWDN